MDRSEESKFNYVLFKMIEWTEHKVLSISPRKQVRKQVKTKQYFGKRLSGYREKRRKILKLLMKGDKVASFPHSCFFFFISIMSVFNQETE